MFYRLLRRGESGLVRGDGLGLRGSGGFVLVKVGARDYLVIVERLMADKIGLVPLIDSLRFFQPSEGGVQIMLRGGE